MALTQLKLYNGALSYLGERKLSSLTEARASRRALDDVWDGGDFKGLVLENGFWNFAIRTVQIDYDPSIDPGFGYPYAIDKPSDWIRTVAISADEYFVAPLLEYSDEAGYIFSDNETLYMRYISNDDNYGGNLAEWPESFSEYAKAFMAHRASMRLTQSEDKTEYLRKLSEKLLIQARSRDAMNEPPVFSPQGSWVSSRRGRGKPKRDSGGSWQF